MIYSPKTKINSIEDIPNDYVRNRLLKLIEEPYVLGVQINGSQATGFNLAESDWDGFLYVTDEYYDSVDQKHILLWEFDESKEPKQLVFDFLLICDKWLQQKLESPNDIEHFAFVEGITIYDKTGKLREWSEKIARYPIEEQELRLKTKYMNMLESLGYASIDHRRGFTTNANLNNYRAIVSAVHIWFTLKKTWTPPLKWFTHHAKQMGMDERTLALFEQAINQPCLENTVNLFKHLEELIINDGYDFPKDKHNTFLELIHTSAQNRHHKHNYI